jgi:hypothetical protein
MGDASGPRHHGGDDHRPDGAPRHLAPGAPPRTPRYVLAYGAPGGESQGSAPGAPGAADLGPAAPVHSAAPGLAGTVPAPAPAPEAGYPQPPVAAPGYAHASLLPPGHGQQPAGAPEPHPQLAETPRHGVPRYVPTTPPPAGTPPHRAPAPGDTAPPPGTSRYARPPTGHLGGDGYDDHDGDSYGDSYDDSYDDSHDAYDDPADEQRGGIGASLRAAWAEAVWRYRSAPLWVRITADVAAASLVLMLIVGVSLALRSDDGPPEATATRAPVSVSTTVTTAATTTTTVPPTTTTVPPTTTTTVPPTTTTAPPVVPPPTEAPTTEAPTTTTTEAVRYRDCSEAWMAGALPLFEGEPGYGSHLDRDGDGEACEWDERRRD